MVCNVIVTVSTFVVKVVTTEILAPFFLCDLIFAIYRSPHMWADCYLTPFLMNSFVEAVAWESFWFI